MSRNVGDVFTDEDGQQWQVVAADVETREDGTTVYTETCEPVV